MGTASVDFVFFKRRRIQVLAHYLVRSLISDKQCIQRSRFSILHMASGRRLTGVVKAGVGW